MYSSVIAMIIYSQADCFKIDLILMRIAHCLSHSRTAESGPLEIRRCAKA
jgi:hypothetical protein